VRNASIFARAAFILPLFTPAGPLVMPTAANMSASVMLAGNVQPEPALGWAGRAARNLMRNGRSFRRLILVASPKSTKCSASETDMVVRNFPLMSYIMARLLCLLKARFFLWWSDRGLAYWCTSANDDE
jgi:hypothetical protein